MCNIIGYAADAETLCEDCARVRYGAYLDNPDATDSEDNPIHPIFSTDESGIDGIACCACGEWIVPFEALELHDVQRGYLLTVLESNPDTADFTVWDVTDDSERIALDEISGLYDHCTNSMHEARGLFSAFPLGSLNAEERIGMFLATVRLGRMPFGLPNPSAPCWGVLRDQAQALGRVSSVIDASDGFARIISTPFGKDEQ